MRNILFILPVLLLVGCSTSRSDSPEATTLEDLAQADLSLTLINPDSVVGYYLDTDENGDSFLAETYTFSREDPLGFIGKDFSRFRIHFDTVFKTGDAQYSVKGCWSWPERWGVGDFSGFLLIDSVEVFPTDESSHVVYDKLHVAERGMIYASLLLVSTYNSNEKWNGTAQFCYALVDGEYRYNAEGINSNSFNNNQYTGTMATEKGQLACNWGDFRIPGAGDNDIGEGEFSPARGKGWESYRKVHEDSVLRKLDQDWMHLHEPNWFEIIDWDYLKTLEVCYSKMEKGRGLTREEFKSIMPKTKEQYLHFWNEDERHLDGNYLYRNVMEWLNKGDEEIMELFFVPNWEWADGWVGELIWEIDYSLWKKYPKKMEVLAKKHNYLETLKELVEESEEYHKGLNEGEAAENTR